MPIDPISDRVTIEALANLVELILGDPEIRASNFIGGDAERLAWSERRACGGPEKGTERLYPSPPGRSIAVAAPRVRRILSLPSCTTDRGFVVVWRIVSAVEAAAAMAFISTGPDSRCRHALHRPATFTWCPTPPTTPSGWPWPGACWAASRRSGWGSTARGRKGFAMISACTAKTYARIDPCIPFERKARFRGRIRYSRYNRSIAVCTSNRPGVVILSSHRAPCVLRLAACDAKEPTLAHRGRLSPESLSVLRLLVIPGILCPNRAQPIRNSLAGDAEPTASLSCW